MYSYRIPGKGEEHPPSQDDEASVMAELVDWAKTLPTWQSDALRRLCVSGDLNAEDLDALTEICKGNPQSAPEPLGADHVRGSRGSLATVYLKGVHRVRHVNALAEDQRLTFDKTGVTVVYGDNGAGKSGYARILKRACRARVARGETVHPNVYAAEAGTPGAAIDFVVNGANRSASWTLGKVADPLLSAVSVFDSRTANVHVDQTNDLAYTPQPLQMLSALAQACKEVKGRLKSETKHVGGQTPAALSKPACQAGTEVGILVASLAKASPADVERLARLSEAEIAELTTLRTDLASDPARQGTALAAVVRRVEEAQRRVEQMIAAVADDKLADLRQRYGTYRSAREAADAASTTLFADQPLPHIGSDAWRALWSAARAYAERDAYVGRPFPVAGDGARCVLCLQVLDAEAAARLNSFEAFVKDESRRRETEAKRLYEERLASVRPIAGRAARRGITVLLREEVGEAQLAAQVRRCLAVALWRSRIAIRDHQQEAEPAFPAAVDCPVEDFVAIVTRLRERSAALLSEAGGESRRRAIARRDELTDREWLAGLKEDVLLEIQRRQAIAALEKAEEGANSNRVTAKSTELAERLVTNTLRSRFAQEVAKLGVAGLAIELRKDKSELGVPYFKVALIQKPNERVGDVLSEGEYRCIALAAFLAELGTNGSQSSIVFDDPVSSLDHMHREAVARRLASEGSARQVIVFTHDIAFLYLLNEACRDSGSHIAFRSINRGSERAGFCDANPPPNAQPVEQVIESLQRQLDNQKVLYEQGKREQWYRVVRSLQEQLRTTWERTVEEAVAPVIRRLGNKVDTKNLPKLTVLTLEDCRAMREAYGRCSELLHSSSEALNAPLPTPATLDAEIKAIRDWVADLHDRQGKVKIKADP